MPTLGELRTLSTAVDLAAWVVGFVVWAVALTALGRAVWRSYLAQTLHTRLWNDPAKTTRIRVLAWELQHGQEYNEDLARGQVLVQGVSLTSEQIAARRGEYLALAKDARWKRVVTYLLQCTFCQQFWTALAVLPPAGHAGLGWGNALATAFAYAYVCTLMESKPQPEKKKGGCPSGNCGER